MNEAKLKALRNKKKAAKEQQQLIKDVADSVVKAISDLSIRLNDGVEINNTDKLIAKLSGLDELKATISTLENAIAMLSLPDSMKIEGLDDLKRYIKSLKQDNQTVVLLQSIAQAVNDILQFVISHDATDQLRQSPEDFIPVRRVMQVGNRLIFDDSVWQAGGGSSGGEMTGPLAVLNPNGTIIGNTLGVPAHDSGTVSYPNATTETYKFYASGSLLKTVTIVYTDSAKSSMASWAIT